MKIMREKAGFSLVELLTVIAIIAILAAIIFPVMGLVKIRAKETQCMTNMHDIAIVLKAYQLDHRRFPETIAGYAVDPKTGNANPPLDQRQDTEGLYPEYIKSAKGLHCPLSSTNSTNSMAKITVNSTDYYYYAYSSYDVYTPVYVAPGATVDIDISNLRYTTNWAPTEDDVATFEASPPGATIDTKLDYKRQLGFRAPSDDTVVTWCSNHGEGKRAMVPVLFLDGHADRMPRAEIEGSGSSNGSRWRTRPKL